MTKKIQGKFEIQSSPLASDEVTTQIGAMRMSFEKTFEGPLSGTSLVSMIGRMNRELGSGAYVALERFTGSLEGKKGEFCLQHSSAMNRGKPSQSITVIPDSGTGELQGLKGSMTIDIAEGQHFYNFEYQFEEE